MWRQRRSRQNTGKQPGIWNKAVDLTWFKKHSAAGMGFLAFILPIWIMCVAFYASAVFPFGDDTFMRGDMFLQYVPFFSEFMRQLKAGQGIAYTWNVGLGSNLLALYGYYLASPFYWFGLFVPEQYYVEFVSWLVPLKIGFCGLFMYLFLYTRQERMNKEVVTASRSTADSDIGKIYRQSMALFFSLGYALSGFLAAYNWNVMWLESLALLPLIVMGLESLVIERRPYLYCLTLAASILSNFYLSIMICIFLVLYFVFLLLERRSFAILRDFVLYSLLAGGIAGVLLVPEICALSGSEVGGESLGERTGSYFLVLEAIARHCMLVRAELGGGTDTNYWPNVYCGVCVFLGVPLYAVNKRIPARRRLGMLVFAGFMLVSFKIPVLDYVWHGMNYPHGLSARESFLYIFLVLLMCHECTMNWDFSDKTQCRKIFCVYLAVVALLLFFEKFMVREDVSAGAIWFSFLFVTVYAVFLYLAFSRQSRDVRGMLLFLAVLTMTVEVHIHTQATSVICNNRVDFFEDVEEYRTLYHWIRKQDTEFYRLEVLGNRYTTDSVRVGFPSASALSSTVNAMVTEFYIRLGLHGGTHYYTFEGGNTAFTAALLNVKYLLCNDERYHDDRYPIVYSYAGDWLYRNSHTLPFGYVAPLNWDMTQQKNEGIKLQNQLFADLGLEGELFEVCEPETAGEPDACFTAPDDGIYYGVLLKDDIYRVLVSGTKVDQNWPYMNQGSVLALGSMKKDQTAYISGYSKTGERKNVSLRIYRMNETALEDAITLLSKQHLENVSFDSTHIDGILRMEEAGRLILSVPYEKGWSVTLNGEKVDPERFGGALMAFDLQQGEYVLEMKYVPYGKWVGFWISIFSVAVLCLIRLFHKTKKANIAG